jgi:hypothetical protein
MRSEGLRGQQHSCYSNLEPRGFVLLAYLLACLCCSEPSWSVVALLVASDARDLFVPC